MHGAAVVKGAKGEHEEKAVAPGRRVGRSGVNKGAGRRGSRKSVRRAGWLAMRGRDGCAREGARRAGVERQEGWTVVWWRELGEGAVCRGEEKSL